MLATQARWRFLIGNLEHTKCRTNYLHEETPYCKCNFDLDGSRNQKYPGKTESLFLAMRSKRQIPPFHAKPVIISTRARQSIGTSEGIALTRGLQGAGLLVKHS